MEEPAGGKTMDTKKVKVGDLFYTSWGYDQTNYDFIVVKELSPSGKTAICQRAKLKDREEVGFMTEKQEPKAEGYGNSFRLKIEDLRSSEWTSDSFHLRGSYPYCDGDVRLGTFYPHKEGKKYYETSYA